MKEQLELMDWKAIETNAENTIRDNMVQTAIANILLTRAKVNIKVLGGKTNDEEEAAQEKRRKKLENSTV